MIEYQLVQDGKVIAKTARYNGFRNIQNLVRRLKPEKKSRMPGSRRAVATGGSEAGMADTAYVEVMACPGGCTNGGGQIKAEDVAGLMGEKMAGVVGAGRALDGTADEMEAGKPGDGPGHGKTSRMASLERV